MKNKIILINVQLDFFSCRSRGGGVAMERAGSRRSRSAPPRNDQVQYYALQWRCERAKSDARL